MVQYLPTSISIKYLPTSINIQYLPASIINIFRINANSISSDVDIICIFIHALINFRYYQLLAYYNMVGVFDIIRFLYKLILRSVIIELPCYTHKAIPAFNSISSLSRLGCRGSGCCVLAGLWAPVSVGLVVVGWVVPLFPCRFRSAMPRSS